MTIAILDPFSGISGDMTLGALIAVGLEPEWLRSLPERMGLAGVGVRIESVRRGDIACTKVDFDIPPQPHGRHLREIRSLVAASGAPESVRSRADAAFVALATVEGEIHGVDAERVHLHEVGAVDAILDVVGSIWGLQLLGVERVHCGTLALGDGTVRAAHGVLPVPAPATLKLLEGHPVRPGPEGSGELVTPTGAALVRVLSAGPAVESYIPLRSGFGAGTKDFKGRANALRLILAEPAPTGDGARGNGSPREELVTLATDIDDMAGEYLSGLADTLRRKGALDVVMLSTTMKKGRPGVRVEVLCRPADADELESALLTDSTSIGVRRTLVQRRALPRRIERLEVLGRSISVKVVTLPDGTTRAKPEFEDVMELARESGRPVGEILDVIAHAQRSR